MKKISLVLSSALFLVSNSFANSLDEAIRDIDISGELRYRYNSAAGNFWNKRGFEGSGAGSAILTRQEYNWRVASRFNAAIADNFRAFIELSYDANDAGYGGDPMQIGEATSGTNTSTPFYVRQYYLTYINEELATSVIAGRMQLDTIWTDNSIDGLVGTGVKLVNTGVEGLTLAAFVIDSFNAVDDGDVYNGGESVEDSNGNTLAQPFNENLYGAATLGNFELGAFSFTPQLWLSYLNDSAFFYAANFGVETTLFDDVQWNFSAAYLGNSVDNTLKKLGFGNGKFFALNGGINAYGFDFSLGGVHYGDKKNTSFTILEDEGNLGDFIAGEEIWYSDGSRFFGDLGQNTFGFVTAGYTFNEVLRIGADFVYGGTKANSIFENILVGGKKFEAVARVSYQYTPKLSFEAFYSYLNIDAKNVDVYKNTTRLQVLYQF